MEETYDLLIIGGGINGTAKARDAAGRGLSVLLCEKDDLASHTSSASTKLIHGGFRYLEYYEFRLVRESLIERERLLRAAPHIIWPLRFVLPYEKGIRPAWLIRLGLFLYDHLGGRELLPGTKTLRLAKSKHKNVLKDHLKLAFEYSDCWVEDARLVVLNAVDAEQKGAEIRTRTEVSSIETTQTGYHATIYQHGKYRRIHAKGIVNSAGPWVEEVLLKLKRNKNSARLRLVKGSHIVTEKLYEGDHCYVFQNADNRIIFTIPYEENFTLIGTTDLAYQPSDGPVEITEEETLYLCKAANEYFRQSILPEDVKWSYSGVRPLYDDQAENASAVTRDYVLHLDEFTESAPFLSVFGGKITTSRKLAEHALEKIAPYFENLTPAWTKGASFPGGDIPKADFNKFYQTLKRDFSDIDPLLLKRMARRYGTNLVQILDKNAPKLGRIFNNHLCEAEVDYLVHHEWVTQAEDILWRRTKAGLHMSQKEREDFSIWFETKFSIQKAG